MTLTEQTCQIIRRSTLKEEFEKVINLHTERIPGHEDLARDATAEFHRLNTIRGQQETSQSSLAELMLGRLEDEQIVQQVEGLLDAARVDPDAANTCGKRILDLRAAHAPTHRHPPPRA